jgi:hypothetical protein
MKPTFEGVIHTNIPDNKDSSTSENPFLTREFLTLAKVSSNIDFRVVTHPFYTCVEYDIRLNLLSFTKFNLPAKITVIGPPVSICEKGYDGDIHRLIDDYKRRKGIFLILNMDSKPEGLRWAIPCQH